jgi:hypothetical protein
MTNEMSALLSTHATHPRLLPSHKIKELLDATAFQGRAERRRNQSQKAFEPQLSQHKRD